MAERTINSKVQQRNDTAANWLLVNPVLLRGELGIELDTGKMKIGNGSSDWATLPYLGVGITQADILNFAYPVGSIKITTTAENPGNTIGGIWERWGNGRFPLAVDENNADFATAEVTGGEKEHTLTVAELPSHTHDVTIPVSATDTSTFQFGTSTAGGIKQDGEQAITSAGTGSDTAHNNMPPYITCYFWKRTA